MIYTQATGPRQVFHQGSQSLERKEIIFRNGRQAYLVAPPWGTPAAEILKALDIPSPKGLIMLIGGASGLDKALVSGLTQLFSRVVARIAAALGALIMDGGTQAGVMSIMGRALAGAGRQSPLLGVAPAGKVTYPGGPVQKPEKTGARLEPNHSHFVLVDSREWGGETATFYELAETLGKNIKVVTILADGGPVARQELLASVRHGWPIFVLAGTGRLADKIAGLKKTPDQGRRIKDPVLAEVIAHGDLQLFSLADPPENLGKLLLKGLGADQTEGPANQAFQDIFAEASGLAPVRKI
jgi:hypothetical protein